MGRSPLYGTLDVGLGYEFERRRLTTRRWNNGVSNIITKQSSHGSQWLWTPNGLSQSVVGVKMSQPLPFSGPFLSGWSLVGTVETGFNPYYGYLADAQRSQVQNNGKALVPAERERRIRAAPASRTTRKRSSASATRPTAP